MPRIVALLAMLAAAAVVATPAGATVRKISFTAVVSPNDYALLTVNVKP